MNRNVGEDISFAVAFISFQALSQLSKCEDQISSNSNNILNHTESILKLLKFQTILC